MGDFLLGHSAFEPRHSELPEFTHRADGAKHNDLGRVVFLGVVADAGLPTQASLAFSAAFDTAEHLKRVTAIGSAKPKTLPRFGLRVVAGPCRGSSPAGPVHALMPAQDRRARRRLLASRPPNTSKIAQPRSATAQSFQEPNHSRFGVPCTSQTMSQTKLATAGSYDIAAR
jgi:hypothetical protein